MKKSDALKQERASKIEAQGNLIKTTETEKRSFTETETTEFNKLDDEIRALDTQIEQAEKIEAAQKRAAEMAAPGAGISGTNLDKREGGEQKEKRAIQQRASIMKAIRTGTAGGKLEGAEKEMNDIALEENRNAGVDTPDKAVVSIPLSFLRATAQTVSEDSGDYGGALVVDQAPRVQMPFAPGDILASLGAQRLTGLTGGDVPLPVGSNYNFAWLTETGAITPQKQKFEGPKLSPKRLGAAVQISNRLLMQSSIAVENWIRQLLLAGYNRTINAAAINGSGQSNQPLGVLNNTDVLLSEVVAQSVPTKAMITELPKLIHSENATENSLAYLLNHGLSALLQNTKVDAGSGRFLMEAPNSLNGSRALVTNHVPDLSDNHVLIYADWSQLFIGEWGSLSVLSDPYSASLSNSVQLVVNGHADVAIAQPKAFAVNKFLSDEAGSGS
jgi:HK97 family phage major capsid protein